VLDDAGGLQFLQTLGEQSWRAGGDPPPDLVEAGATHKQFPQDERRPPLTEDLDSLGDRAELPVAIQRPFGRGHFSNGTSRSPEGPSGSPPGTPSN
jgi:hypothetical protein